MSTENQLTVRLKPEQRRYLEAQLQRAQRHPQMSHYRWSLGDLVRTLINNAIKTDYQIVALPEADE